MGRAEEEYTGDILPPESSVSISGRQVPLQLVQEVFNKFSTRSSKIIKTFDDPYIITLQNLVKLDQIIEAIIKNNNCISLNTNIIVNYSDDTKENYVGFPQFNLKVPQQDRGIESIFLNYKFAIQRAGGDNFENHNVIIRIISRVSLQERMKRNPSIPAFMARVVADDTIVAEVEYDNIIVARNIISEIESWARGIEKNSQNNTMRWFQARSHFIPKICCGMMILFYGMFLYSEIINKSILIGVENSDLVVFLIKMSMILYALYWIAFLIGRSAEIKVDSYSDISTINITSLDQIIYKQAGKRNRGFIVSSTLYFVGNFVLSVLVKLLGATVYKFIEKQLG